MSAATNLDIPRAWLRAFNAHDVEKLVTLYDDHATHTSPKIRGLHPDPGGKIVARAALTAWWKGVIARVPGLRYEEAELTADDEAKWAEFVGKQGAYARPCSMRSSLAQRLALRRGTARRCLARADRPPRRHFHARW